jgi:integrase
MGLGPTRLVPLSKARGAATTAQQQLLVNVDPIEARRAERKRSISFSEATDGFIKAHSAGWTNEKHRWQVKHWMETYAFPTIGKLPVDEIDSNHIVKLLEPHWSRIPETASRIRLYIERVLDWSEAAGYRTGKNPARWRGALEHRLPALSRVQKIRHHVAIPYADAPAVYQKLADLGDRMTALALRFIAVTATRAGEALGARWEEIDLDDKVWVIPEGRMKTRKAHRVPLSDEAVAILELARHGHTTGLVFPGQKPGKTLSDASIRTLLRQVGPADADTHGWRSTFRDWAGEATTHPREVAEMALAHTVGSKVERAYARSDLFDKRRALMDEWAKHLTDGRVANALRSLPVAGATGACGAHSSVFM